MMMQKPSFPSARKIYKVGMYGINRYRAGTAELTPVEIVGKPNKFGYEVDEAGSPLALDNG